MKRMLLHVCCAVCASHAVGVLRDEYDVTLFFANPNIDTDEEYARRLRAAQELGEICGCPLVEDERDHAAWLECVKGLESEPERGRRCEVCFRHNLERTARYAEAHGFDAFTTSLTISPHKDTAMIFRAGRPWPTFRPIDFKKQDGFRKATEFSRQHGLYRQNYCGCEFSRRG